MLLQFESMYNMYKEAFDIVVVDQESFNVVHDIVEFILNQQFESSIPQPERTEKLRNRAGKLL